MTKRNKIHLEIDPPDYASNLGFYRNSKFGACGISDVRIYDINFTDVLDEITCLHCVQKLFKDDKIRLVWK